MTKNCTIDKVKLIMQAGTFNTTNDDVSKFVNSCTEATGQPNTVLYYKTYPQRGGSLRSRNNNYNNNGTQYNNDEAHIEETQEAVATGVEATTIITQVMSEKPITHRETHKTL